MKKWLVILSISLSALILYNSFKVSLIYAYYKLDPIGFIETHCVNKDKPEMHCNGKCYLKKIAQSSNNESNVPLKLKDFKEILLYNEKPFLYSLDSFSYTKNKPYSSSNLYTFSVITECFHPPKI